MVNKKIILISVLVLGLLSVGLFFVFSGTDTPRVQEPIEGYGIANGSCDEEGSIFVQNDSIKNQVKVIEDNAGERARCFANESAYAFSVKLPSETFWCIDSTGFSGEITQDVTTSSCAN